MILQPQRHGDTEKSLTTLCPSLPRRGWGGLSASEPLWLVLIFVVALSAFGCGLKLPPVAPESMAPEPVKDLRALSRNGKLLIVFTKPSKNVDGSKLTGLAGFKVMRRVIEDAQGCKTCPEKFPVVHDIDVAHPVGAIIEGDRIIYTDADISAEVKYEYKVIAYSKDGYEGPEAQRIKFLWVQPPGKPLNLTGKAGDKAVDLKWNSPETLLGGSKIAEIKGYNIYRREDEKYPVDPVNHSPVKENRYTDYGLKNEKVYYYTVRAVIEVNEREFEGTSSDEMAIIPKEAIIEELKGDSDAPLPVQR